MNANDCAVNHKFRIKGECKCGGVPTSHLSRKGQRNRHRNQRENSENVGSFKAWLRRAA